MVITTGMMIITMMNMTQWWHKKYHNDDYDKKSWEATYNLLPRTPAKPWVDNNDENHKTIFKLGRKSYSTKVSPSFDQSIISQNLSREPIAFCMVRGIYAHIHSLFFKQCRKTSGWRMKWQLFDYIYTTNKYNPHWNNFYLSQFEPHCSLTIICIELYGFHQFCSSLEGSEQHIKHM